MKRQVRFLLLAMLLGGMASSFQSHPFTIVLESFGDSPIFRDLNKNGRMDVYEDRSQPGRPVWTTCWRK